MDNNNVQDVFQLANLFYQRAENAGYFNPLAILINELDCIVKNSDSRDDEISIYQKIPLSHHLQFLNAYISLWQNQLNIDLPNMNELNDEQINCLTAFQKAIIQAINHIEQGYRTPLVVLDEMARETLLVSPTINRQFLLANNQQLSQVEKDNIAESIKKIVSTDDQELALLALKMITGSEWYANY